MKIVSLLLVIMGVTYFTVPIIECTDNEPKTINVNTYSSINEENMDMAHEEIDPVETAIKEMQGKMYDIGAIEDKEQWFIAYKSIVEEYEDVLDPPLTIYDYYTDEEIYLIQRVVETECYDQDFISKVNVANVVINRINNGSFGDTVEEVITRENQFAYGRKVITESTILAIEYAFQIEDTTNGCVAFRSGDLPKEWLKWVLVFEDDAGHGFYKFKEE